MGAAPKSPDAYLASLSPKDRAALSKVRAQIRAAAPDATEVISYAMPAFRMPGGVIAWYFAFPNHLSLFIRPNVTDTVPEAKPYRGTKSALHFHPEKPLPAALVKKLVKLSVKDRAPASAAKTAKKAKGAKKAAKQRAKKKAP